MALHERFPTRPASRPVLVVHLEGWIDAGLGAATAAATLVESGPTDVVAVFDGDELIDYRARRPVAHLVDGVNEGLTWRTPRLLLGRDGAGNDLLLLIGPEPDMRWGAFVQEVVDLSTELGVRMAVGLGSFPAPVPHTRAVRVAATSPDPALAARIGFVAGTMDVPAGAQAAVEVALAAAGIPSVGLWARVPHYLGGFPYPAASAALLVQLGEVAGLTLDTTAVVTAADAANRRVDELVAASVEHTQMVRQLEAAVDGTEGNPLDLSQIPSGDEIAAELQRFLGGESRGPGSDAEG